MTNIEILVTELGILLQKPFDLPFKVMLKNSIIGYRATILKQEFDKNGRYPLGSEDSFRLPLINVAATECCCSEDLECTVRRTRDQVPSPVRGNFKPDPFLYVGTANMALPFTYAQPHEIEGIITGSKFTNNDPLYSFYNDYIYVFQFEGGKIGVRDVFSNPLELLNVKDCNGKTCAETINIEDDMKRIIKQMVLEEFSKTRSIIEPQEARINE